MARKKTTAKKATRKRTTRKKTTEKKVEAAKARADTASPPAKRATRLAYPEVADEAWAKGNPEALKKMKA